MVKSGKVSVLDKQKQCLGVIRGIEPDEGENRNRLGVDIRERSNMTMVQNGNAYKQMPSSLIDKIEEDYEYRIEGQGGNILKYLGGSYHLLENVGGEYIHGRIVTNR